MLDKVVEILWIGMVICEPVSPGCETDFKCMGRCFEQGTDHLNYYSTVKNYLPYLFQIIKQIVILDKRKPHKYKKLFLSEDFIYQGKGDPNLTGPLRNTNY